MKKDSLKKGLSGEQAAKSKAEFGTNELAKKQQESLLSMFIGAFDDIWIKVLCFALLLKIVLAVLGVIFPAISGGNDAIEIVSIILAIALATGFSTLSEYRNSSRSEALQEEYSKTFAKVMRDGKLLKISTNEIVKGDTILIQAGDKVPVDGLIFDGHVKVSQAALNGESRDESKVAADNMDDAESTDYSSENKVFMGSVVTSGEAYMVATVIGDASELGKINKALTDNEEEERKDTSSLKLEVVAAGIGKLGVSAAAIAGVLQVVLNIVRANEAITPVFVILLIAEAVMLMASIVIMAVPEGLPMMNSLVQSMNTESMYKKNILVSHKAAFSDSAYMNLLFSDKTGTITIGNRKATHFHTAPGVNLHDFVETCLLSSLSDETPEGKSIVELGRESGIRMRNLNTTGARMIKFTAETKCSGVDLADGTQIRKGAFDAIRKMVEGDGNEFPKEVEEIISSISSNGGTPLVVCVNRKVTGVIELQDIIKPGIQERFERLRKMGVKTVMVTGDNPLTAKYIAEKAGVDDFIAEAKPEDKMEYIKKEQQAGKLVAMMGDGTNDAPALAQANVGVAMNSGTQAAKEAGNMVDLDNDPTKLIEIVEIGKQLLMTRGTLTTFSIANDVAKYFAIIPALFMVAIPQLAPLNIMGLYSPETAILSAVIFNAIIIPILIPLALKGVQYKPIGASALLRRNLLIYGVGGVIAPFVGIKLIDMIVSLFF